MWFSTSSRVSWLQVWKQMHFWLSLLYSTCWRWKETQREFEKKKVLKDQLVFWKKKNVQGCVSQNSDPINSILRKVEDLGLNASAGLTRKFSGCTWYKTEFGKEKGNLESLSKKVNFMSEILARFFFWGTTAWGNVTTSRLYQQSGVEFG